MRRQRIRLPLRRGVPVGLWSLGLWSLVLVLTSSGLGAERPLDFNRDIRPILSDKCFRCHGPDAGHREAELRLDVESEAKAERDGGPAIVPGSPGRSGLVARITSRDASEQMPPPDSGKQLSGEEIERLRRWVEEGAAWSRPWAAIPPVRHPLPPPTTADGEHDEWSAWPRNWIDQFVLSRLRQAGLGPSPEADRVTLIRRLSFDLTGLPPTPADVRQFLVDRRPDAYERLVDRLLASPHYGERMAAYWLDLVRYADTVGYHGDQDHNISPYRDYVIEAFNRNLPLDRFTHEQLAGDLLPDGDADATIASGYNRLLQTSHEGGVQPKEYLAIYAADRVRNLSAVWLGATLGCAQCHDHKYDPYTMRDFYSLVACFADLDEAQHFTKGGNSLPTARPPEVRVHSRGERVQIAILERRLAQLEAAANPPRSTPGTGEAAQGGNAGDGTAGDGEKRAADAAREAERASLLARLKELRERARLTMVSVAIAPRPIRILPRGNWLDDSGPVVEPAVPAFLGELDVSGRATRLDLARWLTDADQGVGGLTARVFANRLWYLAFGEGLARVMDDFGGQGQPPTHPELLDNLAVELVDSGWDVKHLWRQLVTSRSYRQQSLVTPRMRAGDPYNRLLGRQSAYRLPAEAIRDTALAVSGLLIHESGGASVRPYQPAGYYRHLNFPTRKYQPHTDRRQWRRGVYVHWQRQFLHPMLKAFDAPSREECTARRPRSNTPLAALSLLNDPTFVEAARVLAERLLLANVPDDNARLELACQLAISRSPDDVERAALLALLAAERERYAERAQDAETLSRVGLAPPVPELDAREVAAWMGVTRAVLNLDETLTRN